MRSPEALSAGFTRDPADAVPLHLVEKARFQEWLAAQPAAVAEWAKAQDFDAAPASVMLLPGAAGALAGAVLGLNDPLDPFSYGHAAYSLPPRTFRLAHDVEPGMRAALQLGWGLGAYRFTRYREPSRLPALLALDGECAEVLAALTACTRVRDLVNTPTEHMGPEELEQVMRSIAEQYAAALDVTTGDALLAHNFPAIHAVGRASHRAPRLIRLEWGERTNPHVVLVGKGVCFDTGGLDIKPASGMRHMKKDMGGAAHVIALAEWIMARRLPLRITVLVPAVENAIGPGAFRPGEVITTRAGISVEIDNTDAEGRLVLCDALTLACEQQPELVIDFATLTGAARVALGPDLPALYSNDDALAGALVQAGDEQRDPLWRMPLWRPYERYLKSGIADVANAGSSRMAGSITAALYLERFVPPEQQWAHLDVYSWNDSDSPGRPAGGEAQGLRAVFALLRQRYVT